MDIHSDRITWDDTIQFVFPIYKGQVIKVYDGDTITIAAYMPYIDSSPLFRFSVRLNGIDTPKPHALYSPKPHALYSLRGASHPRNTSRSSTVARAAV